MLATMADKLVTLVCLLALSYCATTTPVSSSPADVSGAVAAAAADQKLSVSLLRGKSKRVFCNIDGCYSKRLAAPEEQPSVQRDSSVQTEVVAIDTLRRWLRLRKLIQATDSLIRTAVADQRAVKLFPETDGTPYTTGSSGSEDFNADDSLDEALDNTRTSDNDGTPVVGARQPFTRFLRTVV